MNVKRIPLVKLPSDVQVSIYLIREELKSRRLFHALRAVGLNDCCFQPHLDSLILQSIDMDDGSDETFALYDNIMARRSHKIDADHESLMKQALKAYHELLNAKKELSRKNR